jgi:hypothetical protein
MPVAVLFPLMTLEHFKGTAFQMSLIEVLFGSVINWYVVNHIQGGVR